MLICLRNKNINVSKLALALTLALLHLSFTASVAQQMTVTTDVIDCGQVVFNQPVTAEFEVMNTGTSPLTITDVKTSCGCTQADYPLTPVPAGKSFPVRVTYDARQMGHFYKLLGIYAQGVEQPLMLIIKGVVVDQVVDFAGNYPVKLGDIEAERNYIEFDDVSRGERPQQKINIKNNSEETIQPVVMHLPSYLQAYVSPSKIEPGKAGTVIITLNSQNLNDYGLTQTAVYLGSQPGDKVSQDKEINVSAVLLPNFVNLTESQRQAAPRIVLSADKVKLADMKGGKKKKTEIEISNQGRTSLDISSIQMFTTGLQMSLPKTRLAPGETTKMKITVNEKDISQSPVKPRILIITNDPDNAKVIIEVEK